MGRLQGFLRDRVRDAPDYITYRRRAGALRANMRPGSPIFYIEPRLAWRTALEMTPLPRLIRLFRRPDATRISAFNSWVRSQIRCAPEATCYQGHGFVLKIPQDFPHAVDVAVNDIREIYLENRYSAFFPENRFVESGDVVVDCGASIGAFSIYAATRASDVSVFAFEPERRSYETLLENVCLNGLENRVTCAQAGVASKEGNFRLLVRADCFTMHRLTDPADPLPADVREPNGPSDTEFVHCVTIDQLITERGIPRCNLIKMDIEGAEREALLGAKETIRRFRPRLTLAAYHKPSDPYQLSTIIRELCPSYNVIVSRDLHLYAFV